jgi:4-hydroxy-3-polyprenylbenzoate decarboxylase
MDYKKIIIAISGASGAIYGIKLLESLNKIDIETHLIVSKTSLLTMTYETDYKISQLQNLATYYYNNNNLGALIASGSFKHHGMIIAPCSIKTMSQVATGCTDNLITRAADVALKEKRKLALLVRESPFHLGHLRNMTSLAELGAIIAPPVPQFYTKPQNLDEMVEQTIARILTLFDIEIESLKKWAGV